MIQDRYPRISDNSMNVFLSGTRMKMIRVRDGETDGCSHSSSLAPRRRLDKAIAHPRLRL